MGGHLNSTPRPEYFDLGTYQRHITTSSKEAFTWFNRGLLWCYGFNHDEALECFEKAIKADPDAPMGYWGIAYALGPNYNKPWTAFDPQELEDALQRAKTAIATAREKATTAVESALVDALEWRCAKHDGPDTSLSTANAEYARAMGEVHTAFPADVDVITLYAEALMNLNPWSLWDTKTGLPREGARTLEIKAALEAGLALHPHHPGLMHLYIHVLEMSPTPEVALGPTDRLRYCVPDAGHLNHMPSHLDVLCGRYDCAITCNQRAVAANDSFFARQSETVATHTFYNMYRCHDLHFLLYAAMFAGQSRVALDAAARFPEILTTELLSVRSPPMADMLEAFRAMPVHAMVRFGRWEELLCMPLPQDKKLLCVTEAMALYGKGLASAALWRIADAEEYQRQFHVAKDNIPDSRTLFNNTCRNIFAIASAMLDGELAYRRADHAAAFAHLRRAVSLEDALPYDEPWGWMQPTRHALGALLLEQGHVVEAEAVYRADLGLQNDDDPARLRLSRQMQHPNNVWALHGFWECLERTGRTAGMGAIRAQLDEALRAADVPIRASCFCRRGTQGSGVGAKM